MGAASIIAACLAYPQPGHVEALEDAVSTLPAGQVKRDLERFVARVHSIDLGDWEELHTRTLDLSPHFVPYVGHVVWGESYHRGAFMADLKREMAAHRVDLGGELPDHLAPILRLLDATADPPSELVEVLPGAVHAMTKELRRSDRDNPYRHVLAAAAAHVTTETRLEIRRHHARQ